MKLDRKLSLTIYTNDEFNEVKRVVETDELKIPYRVIKYVAGALQGNDVTNEDSLYNFVINSMDKLDKIIKATFGVSELELEFIDTMELADVGMEIFKWAKEKFTGLKGASSKNAETVA